MASAAVARRGLFPILLLLQLLPSLLAAPRQSSSSGFGLQSLVVPTPCQADVLYEQLNYICVKDEIRCLLGWKNPQNFCRDPVCMEGCDEKHGVCVKPNVCHCRAGYYGYGCGNCIPLPGCMHGGCEDAYECNCFDGWKGIFCSKAICKPGCNETTGFCDRPGDCHCHIGWQGDNCTDCAVLPGCDHGTCSKPMECNCDDGWCGEFCSEPVCKEGCHPVHGSCAEPGECTCLNGYMGELCDRCRPYPGCKHGTCSEPWTCHCEEGWRGIRCDQKVTGVSARGAAASRFARSYPRFRGWY